MNLDDFLPYVLVDVPGCPDPLVKQALLQTLHEFCRESHCWDEVQDPVTMEAGVREYSLTSPSGGKCLTVRNVWLGSRELHAVTMQELQLYLPDWRGATSSDPLYYNVAIDRDSLSVYPTPDGTSTFGLVIRAVYVPSMAATTVPNFFGGRHLDAIVSGTKARLMAVPLQTFSNPELAVIHRASFMNGIADAKAEMMHDRVQGLVTVRPVRFM